MNLKKLASGTFGALLAAYGVAYAATATYSIGTSTGPGGVLTLFGSTSGSSTISTPAVAGTGTGIVLPPDGGTNGQFLKTDGATPAVTTWATASGSGTVTSIATTTPITGGTITATGTIACATCVTSSSPGAGIAHFAGSTQAVTSSAVSLSADVTGTLPNVSVGATPTAAGTTHTLTAPREYWACTGTCSITVPVPAAGYEFCVFNDDNVSTAITLGALGSSAMYENSARTAYGTAGTGTLVVSAAAANKVCIVGRDATHYWTIAYNGTVTVN